MKPLTIASCVLALLPVGCDLTNRVAKPAANGGPAGTFAWAPGGTPSGTLPSADPTPPEPPPVVDPASFAAAVDNPYFPLVPGTVWTYVGQEEGLPKREEVTVLADTRPILGVACTACVERIFLDGELTEMTTHYFAQDLAGNVWSFGEESLEFDGGVPAVSADSWEAGVNGALPWISLSADPQVGEVFTDGGTDEATVLARDATATAPAGTFTGCLDVQETNADDPEDRDRILYAPGVGLVSEESPDGRIDLVSFGR